jgi:prevent-host-death family protein
MKTATLTETKNNLSALIDRVRQGESILILDRGIPVARLEPLLQEGEVSPEGRLERLVRKGIVTPARRPLNRALLSKEPPRTRSGASVLEALLEERREGR